MSKKRKIQTYSKQHGLKRINLISISNNNDFDVEVEKWKKETSVTNVYKKILESCNDTFEMGNQQDRERLLSAGKEESEWQTIGFVSNSNCDHSEPEAVFKKPVATPMPKGRTGKTYHNKRWSHNRKVNVENGSVNGRSALTKSTRALRSIHEDVLNKQNSGENSLGKFNSTVCDGGVSLTEIQIHGFSPIKRTSLRKRITPLRPALLEKLATAVDCSRTKVEKWLANTGKKGNAESDHEDFDSVIAQLAKTKFPANLADKQDPQRRPSTILSTPQLEEHKNKISGESASGQRTCLNNLNVSTDDFSPIPPLCDYFENENTLESCIAIELNTTAENTKKQSRGHKNNTSTNINNGSASNKPQKKRRKRKRICMRTTPNKTKGRKTNSPNLRKPTKKSKSRVDGKELKVLKVSPAKVSVAINEGGELTFQKEFPQGYKLRSRAARMKKEEPPVNAATCINGSSQQQSVQRKIKTRNGVIRKKIAVNAPSLLSCVCSPSQDLVVDVQINRYTNMDNKKEDKTPEISTTETTRLSSENVVECAGNDHDERVGQLEGQTEVVVTTSAIGGGEKSYSSDVCDGETPTNDLITCSAVTSITGKRILFSTAETLTTTHQTSPRNASVEKQQSHKDSAEMTTAVAATSETTESCCLGSPGGSSARFAPLFLKPDVVCNNLVEYGSSVSSDCLDDDSV